MSNTAYACMPQCLINTKQPEKDELSKRVRYMFARAGELTKDEARLALGGEAHGQAAGRAVAFPQQGCHAR